MEIREYAERVLMADTLAGKLWQPEAGSLSDTDPGGGWTVPERPGRPANLDFAPKGQRAKWPKAGDLGSSEARAVLLHSFANHELLAVELMALALLRFPEAPPAFRRGLVRTLQEEQEHTALYRENLERSGVQLGDLPVNGFFWKSISGMQTPLEYVSQLSLTFEQANLDYARHYSQLFYDVGDTETGDLLDRIYRDEIAHVGYGLKWFRRWKEPGEGDWEAWQKQLAFPLSPARAKGNAPFNREGRRKAGLAGEFIESLELFSHSRGRTPWVGWFNPGAEACALAQNPDPALQGTTTQALAHDLEMLPAFSLNAEDVVLVSEVPAADHLRRLREAGVELPQWEVLGAGPVLRPDSELRGRKLARLRPWAWSADSAALLEPLVSGVGEAGMRDIPWDAEVRSLYTKSTGAGLARQVAEAAGLAAETVGVRAGSEAEVAEALDQWRERGYERACLKVPFGIAGRGMVQVSTAGLAPRDLAWLRPMLAQQGEVVVEAWLDRVADFSCQYELTPGQWPKLKGQVRLNNDPGGRFLGCDAAAIFTRLLPPAAARCLNEAGAHALYTAVLPPLLAALPGLSRLQGALGIDAMVYRDLAGAIRLRPVVEINPRMTMGRVALDLRRLVDPAAVTRFRVVHRRRIAASGAGSLVDYAWELQARFPPVMRETSSGRRLGSGQLVLNDPQKAREFLAVLEVGAAGPCSGNDTE